MINPFKTKTIAVLIPTLNRPQAIWRVAENLRENTNTHLYELYFILEKGDEATLQEAKKYGQVIFNEGKGCYADAINTAYKKTAEPYFFTGADDLGFHPEWAEQALSHMKNGVYVVGTNDLGSIPITEGVRNATHYLVARKYIQEQSGRVDERDTVLYPYDHNYTDVEFTETAKSRGAYVYCPKSVVEHFHPVWGKSIWDTTYKKGQQTSEQDRRLFTSRQHLWAR